MPKEIRILVPLDALNILAVDGGAPPPKLRCGKGACTHRAVMVAISPGSIRPSWIPGNTAGADAIPVCACHFADFVRSGKVIGEVPPGLVESILSCGAN